MDLFKSMLNKVELESVADVAGDQCKNMVMKMGADLLNKDGQEKAEENPEAEKGAGAEEQQEAAGGGPTDAGGEAS